MEPISDTRRAWAVAGIWSGRAIVVVNLLVAALRLAGLLLYAVYARFLGVQVLEVLGILTVGLLLGWALVLGGRIALGADSLATRRQGTLLQVVPAVLIVLILVVVFVSSVIAPNVGSGRYVRDYSYLNNTAVAPMIEDRLNTEYAPSGTRITCVLVEMAEEQYYDPDVVVLMNRLCSARGLPAVSTSDYDSHRSSLMTVEFTRGDGSYTARLPVHNLADDIKNNDDYVDVAVSRIRSLIALDQSHWKAGPDYDSLDPTVYYGLKNYAYSAPYLVP